MIRHILEMNTVHTADRPGYSRQVKVTIPDARSNIEAHLEESPSVQVWDWRSFMHAIVCSLCDQELAYTLIGASRKLLASCLNTSIEKASCALTKGTWPCLAAFCCKGWGLPLVWPLCITAGQCLILQPKQLLLSCIDDSSTSQQLMRQHFLCCLLARQPVAR